MRIWYILILSMLISGCGNSREKTGEAALFHSDNLNIKLVQIYTDMPWHYYGLSHEIWCQSPQTSDLNYREIDRGWTQFSGSSISEPGQSPSREIKQNVLNKATSEASRNLHVINEHIFAYSDGEHFTITFDACRSFLTWSAKEIPSDLIVPLENSPYCLNGNCPSYANFLDARSISYSDVHVDEATRKVSFLAQSKAFLNGQITIASEDAGVHWKVVSAPSKSPRNNPTP
jgi:hypothetical protein